jgi:hypothetical protein
MIELETMYKLFLFCLSFTVFVGGISVVKNTFFDDNEKVKEENTNG